MSLIVKRATKGSGLTSSEIDANVNNLNNDKVEINNPNFKSAPSLVNNLIPLTGTVLPAIYPSLNLDFANGKQLDPRITFSRNTVATYYDGKTTKLAEQNLLIYSQAIGGTGWTTINMGTLNGTNYTAPDGTLTASLVTSTGVDCYFTQNNYYTAGQSYTFSVYLKADVNTSISFGIGVTYTTAPVTTAWQRFTFNMASATGSRVIIGGMNSWGSGVSVYIWGAQLEQRSFASTYTPTTSTPITNYVSAIIAAPAGVPRFDYDPVTKKCLGLLIEELRTNSLVNSTIDGANLTTQSITTTAVARTLSFYGTGTIVLSGTKVATIVGLGAYPTRTTYTYTPTAGTLTLTVSGTVQYANDEVGAFATSYIPTAGTALSRAADQASMTGTNFSSWYNQSEGSFCIDYLFGKLPYSGYLYDVILGVGNTSPSQSNEIIIGNTNGNSYYEIGLNAQAIGVNGPASSLTKNITALSYGNSTFIGVTNGSINTSPLVINGTNFNILKLGCNTTTGQPLSAGHIRKLSYYPKALTAVELQGLTS